MDKLKNIINRDKNSKGYRLVSLEEINLLLNDSADAICWNQDDGGREFIHVVNYKSKNFVLLTKDPVAYRCHHKDKKVISTSEVREIYNAEIKSLAEKYK